MTGYAQVRQSVPGGDLAVTLKSVNHRALDLHFHLPVAFDRFEPAIRGVMKKHFSRGHVDIRTQFTRAVEAARVGINQALLAAYLNAFDDASRTHGLTVPPDLNHLLRLPGLLTDGVEEEFPPDFEPTLLALVDAACLELNRFREREGGELAAQLIRHNLAIRGAVIQMEGLRADAQNAIEARLRGRLVEMLEASRFDPQRVIQEAALIADRSNVEEELARLRVHSNQLEDLVGQPGEVGKKLDFLLQEMNRETNTILSKTSGIGEIGLKITDLALAAKSDIEKIREQALNLE